ncbi:hypothetical protein SM11_chr2331 [Sinorhizobium meliloti SM11]|uniref:Uncharacterized protein n=1 Tax=Sinorhizobium meliloti (strain SM11) TaxID=707241 RepID=F7X3I8_SINMM|nr:hypothetical protein [Sinorhizobium meliloti]AEH79585.1 hypothetical protein SM11_chr2331 [Sinorhizobium meliloti SM11]MDE4557562.1 hypothetical protein [Sinorhizobium meliloti SM11]
MTNQDIYISTDTYFHAIDRIEQIVRTFDPEAPDMVRSDIIQVLGEELGMWPEEALTGSENAPATLAA